MVTSEEWMALRTAVEQTGDRLAQLVETAATPDAQAVKGWSVVQTAAHVATVGALHNLKLAPAESELRIPGLQELLRTATVDSVSPLNELMLRHFTEREPAAVAAQVRSEVAALLRHTAGHDPGDLFEWLGGAQLSMAGVLAHMLNELSIHGRDIARAVGMPWVIPPEHAATFFDLFVVGMVRAGYGRLLDVDGPPAPGRIAVNFRSDTGSSVVMVLQDGHVSLGGPSDPIDVRVSYHPTIMNLMMFGRVSKARAILSGKVRMAGRRPWLLPKFLQTVRMPS